MIDGEKEEIIRELKVRKESDDWMDKEWRKRRTQSEAGTRKQTEKKREVMKWLEEC